MSKHVSRCIGRNFGGRLKEISRYKSRLVEQVGVRPDLKVFGKGTLVAHVRKRDHEITNLLSLCNNRRQIEQGECEMSGCGETKQRLLSCGSAAPDVHNGTFQRSPIKVWIGM